MQGLLAMLSDARQKLNDRDLEIAKLRAEIKKLKAAK
jgi:hypothetical protein